MLCGSNTTLHCGDMGMRSPFAKVSVLLSSSTLLRFSIHIASTGPSRTIQMCSPMAKTDSQTYERDWEKYWRYSPKKESKGYEKKKAQHLLVWSVDGVIGCVHMTSRRPCWRSKQRNGGHLGGVKYYFAGLSFYFQEDSCFLHYTNADKPFFALSVFRQSVENIPSVQSLVATSRRPNICGAVIALGFMRISRWGAPQSPIAFMSMLIQIVLPAPLGPRVIMPWRTRWVSYNCNGTAMANKVD